MSSPSERAAELIESYNDKLAAAIARQIQATVPRYEESSPPDLEQNLQRLVGALAPLVRGKNAEELEQVVKGVAEMRATAGFNVGEFTVAALCFMPVLRNFFRERADSADDALAMYDAVEAVGLPFCGRIVSIFAENQPVAAGGIDVKRFLSFLDSPVGIASVDA